MSEFYNKITIPTTSEFVVENSKWITSHVSKKFKREKSRILDFKQMVILRMLKKDFVSRWFFKHLAADEHTTLTEINKMFGYNVSLINTINPVEGDRNDNNSVWKIGDILKYKNYCHSRQFYSIMNNRVSSKVLLTNMGYNCTNFNTLRDKTFSGEITPFILKKKTKSISVDDAIQKLIEMGLTSDANWESPALCECALSLKWDDTFLKPYVGSEYGILHTPRFIVRNYERGIKEGFLKYAQFVIEHAINNQFTRMKTREDTESTFFSYSKMEAGNRISMRDASESHNESKNEVIDLKSSSITGLCEALHDFNSVMSYAGFNEMDEEFIKMHFSSGHSRDFRSKYKMGKSVFADYESTTLSRLREVIEDR